MADSLNNLTNHAVGSQRPPRPRTRGRRSHPQPSPPGHVSMLTDYISAEEQLRHLPQPGHRLRRRLSTHRHTSLSSSRSPTSATASTPIKSPTPAPTHSERSASSTTPSPASTQSSAPTGRGTIPAGITGVLHSPTDLVATFPRVFQDDTPEDKAAIQPLLNQIVALSALRLRRQDEDHGLEEHSLSFPSPASTQRTRPSGSSPKNSSTSFPIILKTGPTTCPAKKRSTPPSNPSSTQPRTTPG